MKKFTALFMMMVMLLALIGCGNNDMEKFVGVWSGETIGGVETNPYSEYLSGLTDLLSGMVASSMRLELEADGTGSLYAFGENEEIKWTASGNSITIKAPDRELKGEYTAEKIVIKSEDGTSTFSFTRSDK